MILKNFEVLPHTADIKMRAYGSSISELFNNSLEGMFTILKPIGEHINYEEKENGLELICRKFTAKRVVNVRSTSIELLLVDFLSECLYLSDVNNEAYFQANFNILEDNELEAIIYGTKIESFELGEIKAVTYHELEFEQIDGIWQATIIFDV